MKKSSGRQTPNLKIAALEERIRQSPQLVVDYVRLALLLEESGDPRGAAAVLQRAHFFLPNAPTIVTELGRLSKWVDTGGAAATISRPATTPIEKASPPEPKTPVAAKPKSPEHDDLDQLIEGLEKGRLGPKDELERPVETEWSDDDGVITTETLAHIYVAQSQFEEAVMVYDRLAMTEKNSEKAEELRQKASELRAKLRDSG
ncbi:MAG TPA: hypothetical protein VMO47_07855 [Rhodothermales bacterium]|nr:hypothetical protein [Rhodothermales bacterium]